MKTDPVCGMDLEEKNSGISLRHDGDTFYFCSTKCRDEFEKSPENFI